MKVTLQRNVHGNVDILLDKKFADSTTALEFFATVGENLRKKRFVLKGAFTEDGRTFQEYLCNRKYYILGVY